ncbi:small subunit terminase [Lactococcus phage 53801]|nr:small subunit terminase [Lactococcus phage 53801]ANT43524.1 terminase small subunit [Lactococcus phage 53802]
MKLTEKQKKFCDEYIKLGNATQSAINAGYSKQTARSQGQRLLTNVDIKNYIDERMEQLASERIMSAQEAVELLSSIARAEITERVVVSTPMGVEEVDKPPDLKTRMQAIREILKRYPDNDKLLEQQLRKVTADADIAEFRVEMIKNVADESTEDKLDELLGKISEVIDDK